MSKWKEKYLREIADIRVSNVDKKIYPNKSLVKLCNYMDAYSNDYITRKISFSTGSADANEIQRFGLKIDDVIITKDSETPEDIAVSSVVTEELQNVVCGYHLAILRPDKNQIDGKYLMLKLKGNDAKSYFLSVANGSTRFGLTIGNIEKAKISFPTLHHQRRIAFIISTVDAVIDKTQIAIAKYKAIKHGMLHDLLTRGIDISTGKLRPKYNDAPDLYKESKLGWVPKEWDVDNMESLTEKIGSGVTPTGGSEIYKSSGVLFLRSQNILIGSLSIDDAAFITNEIDEKMETSRVRPFDVLLNITGASIGRCAYFPIELKSANVNQHVCIIRFKNISKPLAIFASEFLNSGFGQSQINRSNAGGNRDGLNFQQIKSFHFPVLEVSELEKISEVVEAQNQKLFTEQAYLQKLQQIKAGLMDDLLSGKKEVIIKEEVLNG